MAFFWGILAGIVACLLVAAISWLVMLMQDDYR